MILRRLHRSEPPPIIHLGGRAVPLVVRKSPRAKRIALKVDSARAAVELVLPQRAALSTGLRFLEERRGWVEARIAQVPERVPFIDGAIVPVLGVPHRIRHMGERALGRHVVVLEAGEIRVCGPVEHIGRRIRDHLVRFAREEMTVRSKRLAVVIGCKVERVSVRDTRSRWGSCAASGSLAFSWRLILAPERVLDYVVAHEVAHLAEMSHSRRFWRIVERLAPGSERERDWLRRNRPALFSYG